MLGLKFETPDDWASKALENPGALLLDHLFCERKAAAMAISLLKSHRDAHPSLEKLMHELAAEENDHAAQVERLLKRYPDVRQEKGGNEYAQALRRHIHTDGNNDYLDMLIVCSLIEARSAERFQLLANETRGSSLGTFYEDLYASEVSHFLLFVELGVDAAGESKTLERLNALRTFEAELIRSLPAGSRIHSGLAQE
jgi:tRNA-(ms[2]io[6]A)-hydroxylase